MGYTVSVEPRTPELKTKMLAFWKKNFKRWSEVSGWDGDYASELRIGGELWYDSNPNRIGFDYSSSSEDREYAHALVRWMAIRVGKVKNGKPEWVYDGNEHETVDPKQFDQHGWWIPEGFDMRLRSLIQRTMDEMYGGRRAMEKLRAELIRLSGLWSDGQ